MLLAETNAALLDDGTLRFQVPGFPRAHYTISPWQHGFETRHTRGGRSRAAVAWPIVVLPPDDTPCGNPDVTSFVAEIPADVAQLVRRYQFGQSLLLASLALLEEVEDLAQSNAPLLWLLALGVYEGRVGIQEVGAFCSTKQTEMLRVLAGCDGKAHVRFLRKVRPLEGTLGEARVLCQAVREPEIVHALRHRREIPIRLLSLLTAHPRLAREELVPVIEAKLAEKHDAEPERVRRLHLALHNLEAAQPRARDLLGAVEAAMRELDDPPRLVREALRSVPQREYLPPPVPAAFPAPPLKGTATIAPIVTEAELQSEGAAQRNCVGGYGAAVRERRLYIYRVLAPQRATLEIKLARGKPKLGELKLSCNRKPDAATVNAVKAWFEAACESSTKPAGTDA